MVWHWLGISMVRGSSFGELKLNFIFAILGFWLEFEGLRETLDAWATKGGWETNHKDQWMIINITIKPWIRFFVIT